MKDNLDCTFASSSVPVRVEEILRNAQINILRLALPDDKLLGPVVEVDHIGEIWREEVWHACLVDQALGEALDLVQLDPLNRLTVVFIFLWLAVSVERDDFVAFVVDVNALVDCADKVVDHFHHLRSVLAQVKPLHGL